MTLPQGNSVTRQRLQVAALLLSLALNALLLWNLRPRTISASTPAPSRIPPASDIVLMRKTPAGIVTEPLHWQELSLLDHYALRERLLEAGCPQDTVGLILETVIDRAYLPKLVENFARSRSNFWDNAVLVKTPRNAPGSPEEKNGSHAFNALLDERDNLLKQLVRPDWNRQDQPRFEEDESDPRLAYLSEDKRRLIANQNREIFDLRQDWRRAGIPERDINEKIAELQGQHATERSVLLAPEEIEEYNLRSSRFSHLVQNRYSFEPSPAERKAIIQLHEAHNGQVPEAELQQALGPDRFARFQRSRDDAYEDIYKFGASLNLPEDAIIRVFDLRKGTEAAAKSIHERHDLTNPHRKDVLRRLHEQALSRLTEHFGPEGRDLYLKNGGWWITNLQPN